MYRFKLFCATDRGGLVKLESEINGWLEKVQPSVRQMSQSGTAEWLIVTFLYEENHRGAQMHMTSAAVPEAFERSLDDLELDSADEPTTLLPDAELPY
jgi:hypothetical protein